MKFRELAIGDTFDFVSPNSMLNSFYNTCEKIGARSYRWKNPVRCSLSPEEYLSSRCSINCIVYHVNENKVETPSA